MARLSLAVLLVAGGAAPARAFDIAGSYTGSIHRTVGAYEENRTLHQYNVGSSSTTPGGLDILLRGALTFTARPGEDASSLLRSRLFADLRKSNLWRVQGQVVPWQGVSPGPDAVRERVLHLGADLTPRNAPQLRLHVNRQDRVTDLGPSRADDRRAQLGWSAGSLNTGLSFRRLSTEYAGAIGGASDTREWRGDLGFSKSLGPISTQVQYDALYNRFESGARERLYYAQRGNLGLNWRPVGRVQVGGSALARWGRAEDNNQPEDGRVDERNLSGYLEYRPLNGLSLQASRDYRRSAAAEQNLVSDFARFQAMVGRELARRVVLQSGFIRAVDLASEGGALPASTAFVTVDGPVRRGLEARGELRLSRPSAGEDLGDLWRRMLQLRMIPTRSLRTELTWRRDTLPATEAVDQKDREWDLLVGYEPWVGTTLTTSWRRLDGAGRVHRQERFGSLNASWRTGKSTLLSLLWSRRVAQAGGGRTDQVIWGSDLSFRMSGGFRTKLSWRRSDEIETRATSTYGLTVDASF